MGGKEITQHCNNPAAKQIYSQWPFQGPTFEKLISSSHFKQGQPCSRQGCYVSWVPVLIPELGNIAAVTVYIREVPALLIPAFRDAGTAMAEWPEGREGMTPEQPLGYH